MTRKNERVVVGLVVLGYCFSWFSLFSLIPGLEESKISLDKETEHFLCLQPEEVALLPVPDEFCVFTQNNFDQRIQSYLERQLGESVAIERIENYFPIRDSSVLRLPEPILWIHIPKTAGTSLGHIFASYEAEKNFRIWDEPLTPTQEVRILNKDVVIGKQLALFIFLYLYLG
mgnify:CR=1 FL=1